MVFKTRCGMFLQEENFVISLCGSLFYGGNHYPYNYCGHMKKCLDCENCIVRMGNVVFCELMETAESFDYDNSVNKTIREDNASFYRERDAIVGDGYCSNVLQYFNKAIKQMDLDKCISKNCQNKICHVTGRARTEKDLELVNIFYDIKNIVTIGFLVEETWIFEQKWFKNRIARDLAERYIENLNDKNQIFNDGLQMYNIQIKKQKTRNSLQKQKTIKVNIV